MEITAYDLAERFVGLSEVPGKVSNPQILAMLHLDQKWPKGDETPWCSGFVNYIAWLLRLPRSKSLRARSWLGVGVPVDEPVRGFDVAVLWRGTNPRAGHVGFFASMLHEHVAILGGNQGDSVSVAIYPKERLLGFRRLRA